MICTLLDNFLLQCNTVILVIFVTLCFTW